jgi:hypothetical protein
MNALGLDISTLTARGRKPAPIHAYISKELDAGDLALLGAERTEAPALQRITERHHALAKALASGMSEGEAAALVGYTNSRVSILKGSPAFAELLDLYRDKKDAEFAEFHAVLAGLSKDAALELRERLETSPEELSVSQLLEVLRTGADRTGYGPSQKQETTVRFDLSNRLEAARQRALEAQRTPLDITPESEE